jgi:hypothetical protein
MKSSLIYCTISTFVPYLSILSLVNKFDLIVLEFGPKMMQPHKKKDEDQIGKKKQNFK